MKQGRSLSVELFDPGEVLLRNRPRRLRPDDIPAWDRLALLLEVERRDGTPLALLARSPGDPASPFQRFSANCHCAGEEPIRTKCLRSMSTLLNVSSAVESTRDREPAQMSEGADRDPFTPVSAIAPLYQREPPDASVTARHPPASRLAQVVQRMLST